jgi:HK97 family phage major capsid protein
MAKTAAELSTENPEAVASIRTEAERATRTAVLDEVKQSADATNKKLLARNKEINALANEFVKSHGRNWNGKPNEVYVVGERIRALEAEICALPADHDAAEARRDFKRKADEYITGSREPKNQEQAANLPQEVAGRCSLRNLYNTAARSGEETKCFIPKEGAEAEAHQEIHNRAKDYPDGVSSLGQGCILPMNMPVHGVRSSLPRNQRDALAGDFASAGALIAPQYQFPAIELLRNRVALANAGMTIISGAIGTLILPRQEAPTTAQSAPEAQALQQYDQVFGQIRMTPNRVGSSQKYSRLALLQTTPDFEALVLSDHMAVIALYIDEMGVNGSGAANQPVGILNTLGINVVTFGAAASYSKIVSMETKIRQNNVYEPVSFISTSAARGVLRVAPETLTGSTVVSGSTNAIWKTSESGNETIIGRPAVDSQQVPGDVLIAGAFRHMLMAQWGGLAVVLDTVSLADKDMYKLSINTYIDFAVRHAQAFTRSSDSAAQ